MRNGREEWDGEMNEKDRGGRIRILNYESEEW